MVDFWASWCAPCRQENPILVKAYKKFKSCNFEIVGVSLDDADGKQKWIEAIKKDGLPWIHVSDLKGWENAAALSYDIRSIPQNLLIDPAGIIVAKNLRGEQVEKVLSGLLCK